VAPILGLAGSAIFVSVRDSSSSLVGNTICVMEGLGISTVSVGGVTVGDSVGDTVGDRVGEGVVGTVTGALVVGVFVGDAVGFFVGGAVGFLVGLAVGFFVGLGVGLLVGFAVVGLGVSGVVVGASVAAAADNPVTLKDMNCCDSENSENRMPVL